MSTDDARLESHYLHKDLTINILSKLPVKSLIRFKCVCKSWYDLIENPRFIDLHLNRSDTNKDHKDYLVLLTYDRSIHGDVISFISYNTLESSSNLSSQNPDITNKNVSLIGSCNGLLCLSAGNSTHYVMNPATREYKQMAREPAKPRAHSYGFGFDPKADDYKLVRITRPMSQADVVTLRNNSWRSVDSVPEGVKVIDYWSKTVLNNVIHWCGTLNEEDELKPVVVGFDLVNEVFRDIIRIPYCVEQYQKACDCFYDCHVFKGCLSIAATYGPDQQDCFLIELWAMKEYGVEESWTKQYLLDLTRLLFVPQSIPYKMRFSTGFHGELVVYTKEHILTLRRTGEDSEIVFAHRTIPDLLEFTTYRESLVRINRN